MISKTPRQQVPDTTLTPLRRAWHTWQPETNTIITSMALWSYWRAIRRSPSVGRSARIGMMTRGGIACRGTLKAMASTASRIPDAICRRKKTFRVFDWILSSLLALIFSDRWKFTSPVVYFVSNHRSKQRIGFNPLKVLPLHIYLNLSIRKFNYRWLFFVHRLVVKVSREWRLSVHQSVHRLFEIWSCLFWAECHGTLQTTRMQCQFATTRITRKACSDWQANASHEKRHLFAHVM